MFEECQKVENLPNALEKETVRAYKPFDYVGAPDAENIIIAMGSVCETIEETMDVLLKEGRRLVLSRFVYTTLVRGAHHERIQSR